MPYPLLAALLWCLACLAAGLGLVQHDQQRWQQGQRQQLQALLQPRAAALGQALDSIAAQNQALAAALAQEPHMSPHRLGQLAAQAIAQEPRILSVVLMRQLKAQYVYPEVGNEALLGLNYGLRPEFLRSIERAERSRRTVFNAPVRMPQSGHTGVVARTAIFIGAPSPADDQPAPAWGQVSMAAALEPLLQSVGLRDGAIGAHLALRSTSGPNASEPLWGDPSTFERPHASAQVHLPDGHWELAAAPAYSAYPQARAAGIGSAALVLALLPLLLWWRHQRRLGAASAWAASQPSTHILPPPSAAGTSGSRRPRRRVPLRFLLLLALALPVPLLVGLAGWLSLQTSMRAARALEQGQAQEVALRVRDKVSAFMDVPRQMVTYNTEQFRSGLLQLDAPQQLQHQFLLQLRYQPWLTFLSVGTKDGAYYGASRPPLGQDRVLRLVHNTAAPHGTIQIQRVNDDYQPIGPAQQGNADFDPRRRPWYQAAITANSIRWYPTYRYAIHDPNGLYDTLGLGMSSPLYNSRHEFLGVLTADVALSQLSEFLHAQITPLGGFAFVTEGSGELLASSDNSPLYRLQSGRVQRLRPEHSSSAAIRQAALLLQAPQQPEGTRQAGITVDAEPYLTHRQTLQLPNGPTLHIVIGLPQHHFDGPSRDMLRNMLLLTLGFWALAMVLVWWLAQRLAQPLATLSHWASQLAEGQWHIAPPQPSPVREIATLSRALARMARRLRRHTLELELRVAERTTALAAANQQLAALAATDGLTGLANRRQFDQHLANEIARSQRSGAPLALLLLDVDHFKAYNDYYGHQEGDRALQSVAQLLQSCARRPGDLAARYGGEEFALIATDSDAHSAQALGQHLCQQLAALALPHANTPSGRLGVSIGIACLAPGQSLNPAQLLQQADAALYQAKAQGRNQVVQAPGAA